MSDQQEMIERKLTDWFDGAEHKPSRLGWYNTLLKRDGVDTSEASPDSRRYWDGEEWSCVVYLGDSDEDAAECMMCPSWDYDEVFWRGCTEEQFE